MQHHDRVREGVAIRSEDLAVALVVEGGAPMHTMVVESADQLRAKLRCLRVVSVRDDPVLASRLGARGISYNSLGAGRSGDYVGAVKKLSELIGHHEINVVHGVEPIAASIANLAAIRRARVGRLFDRQHSKPAGRPARALSLFASRTADVVRVPSNAAVEWTVAEDKVKRGKIKVVHNAAGEPPDTAQAAAATLRSALGVAERDCVVCSVARLRDEKRLEIGIEAVRRLGEVLDERLHYVIVGDGPVRPALQAAALGIPRIHFVGHSDDVWPWYALSDVVWMPSDNESFGIAAAEAQASGIPVVATRTGGLAEVVDDGVTGMLIPPRNVEALVRASELLLSDRPRRLRMGLAARSRYERLFSPGAIIAAMRGLYVRAAISATHRGRRR